MMKGAVLYVVLLWAIAGAVLSSHSSDLGRVSCENLSPNCTCSIHSVFYREVVCPQLVLQIKLDERNIQLQCKTSDDPSAFSTISGLNIEDSESYTVRFWLCPLPNTSIQEVMESIGIKRLKSLQIQSYSNYSDSLQKKHFEKLYEVTNLILTNNGLTSLPHDIFQDMGNLTWLDMKQNNIDLPKEVFNFTPKLEVLELGKNNLTHLKPGLFKNLDRLRLMNLWGNKLVNLTRSVFFDVPNLESLDLNSNEMETIRPDLFADLMKLKRLNLYANAFISLPQGLLSRNTDLEEFQMHENKRSLMNLPPGFLSNLTALKIVRLSGCKLTSLPEDTFSNSKKIQEIFINRNQLKTLSQNTFADLENLFHLDLSQNQIEHLPAGLFARTKKLKVLKLQYNQLGEITHGLFLHLRQLEVVDLRFNQIREIKGEFNTLEKLKSLNISDNQLTTMAPDLQINDGYGKYSALQKCNKLEDLQLANNSLTEIYGDWKLLLNRLHTLNLAFNQISRVEVNDLDFSSDISIDLSNNKIKEVDFWKANLIAFSHLEGFNSTYERDSKTKPKRVILDNNPFTCNCVMLPFAEFLRNELEPEVNYLFNIRSENLKCSEPQNLEKILLSKVPYKLLTCELTNVSSNYTCPSDCICEFRTFDKGNIINCQNAGLQYVPQKMSQYQYASHSELNLEGNRLQRFELPDDASYKNVTHFNLSKNNITDFSVNRFSTGIKELDISNNNLTMLSDEVVAFLDQAGDLKLLEVHGNPWRCDCDAKPLIRLIKTRYTLVAHIQNVTCADGTELGRLEESELCSEQASILIAVCVIFAVFGFLIAILTALYYRYRTQIYIYCFSSKWKILRWVVSHPDDVDEGKKYDAFISFSHGDELFVSEQLVPYLEEHDDNQYKICLHYRDWIPGESIPNQILHSVQSSRRTIVVLSPNFLESVWGKVEFRTAHAEALKDGTARVIVILYEDVGPINDLDDDLKAYLQMNSYVKWGSPWFWQQLKYALPHPPEDADNISCSLCCISKSKHDSSSHEILQNVQLKDGEVHYNMSDVSGKVNGKDKNISSDKPLLIQPIETKTKEPPSEKHQNGKAAACV